MEKKKYLKHGNAGSTALLFVIEYGKAQTNHSAYDLANYLDNFCYIFETF